MISSSIGHKIKLSDILGGSELDSIMQDGFVLQKWGKARKLNGENIVAASQDLLPSTPHDSCLILPNNRAGSDYYSKANATTNVSAVGRRAQGSRKLGREDDDCPASGD